MEGYEDCIFGIEATIDLRIKILEVYGDSALVISKAKDIRILEITSSFLRRSMS